MADGDNQYKSFAGFKRLRGDEDNPTHGILVDDASKTLHICEPADQGTDWALAAATHPTICIHSATNPATEYIKIYHDATNAYIDAVGATTLQLLVAGTAEISLAAASVSPTTTDGAALGTTALMWSDLFLASGAVINFNNGDVTITHAANSLTFAGGVYTFTGNLAFSTGTDLTFVGTTGTNDITLTTNLADALSIADSAADIIVIATTTGSPTVTITPATTVTGKLTANGSIDVVSAGIIAGLGTGANGMVLKNPKNAAASALSGTQLDVEIDIGGTAYHFTTYPTKA